jgi:hypothetical protein
MARVIVADGVHEHSLGFTISEVWPRAEVKPWQETADVVLIIDEEVDTVDARVEKLAGEATRGFLSHLNQLAKAGVKLD